MCSMFCTILLLMPLLFLCTKWVIAGMRGKAVTILTQVIFLYICYLVWASKNVFRTEHTPVDWA